jgi:hypothetical protein
VAQGGEGREVEEGEVEERRWKKVVEEGEVEEGSGGREVKKGW